jgi:hypothetical protein
METTTPVLIGAFAVRLRFAQPPPRLTSVNVVEVSDRRRGEGPAERRHAVLPLLFPDHREPFNAGKVFAIELDVLL